MSRQSVVSSPVGKLQLDSHGSAIGAVRMNPELAYSGIPLLLKEVIDRESEAAWEGIRTKIDYMYSCLTCALSVLDDEVAFSRDILARVKRGQKLLFKPNIVFPAYIDHITHGPGNVGACTPWPFVAALMRWFHDKLGITYHQMSLGEAGTGVTPIAGAYTLAVGRKQIVTPEAVIEGKWGTGYGGWGFYFVRRYLADNHPPDHSDDPMKGYEDSITGVCLPPGRARGKLMVYDLNRIEDDGSNGRDVPVAHGINFKSVTIHKAVIGGDPGNPEDLKEWPGCVLVNVPRLKIHNLDLLTCAVKNLGIGLYPMVAKDSNQHGEPRWKYAHPNKLVPGVKSGIPHTVWVLEIDEDTGMPKQGKDGEVLLKKTGGLSATIADMVEAVKDQGISMFHVVDAIEPVNRFHTGPMVAPIPEGYAFAARDPVALDLLCARYLFTTVPMAEAKAIQREKNLPTSFLQRVPIPRADGHSIMTEVGFDSPISRYDGFKHWRERGLGQQDYYVVGRDEWQGGALASVEGHLGKVKAGEFSELITREMYFSALLPLWDLQATTLAYAEANDTVTGTGYKPAILHEFDENGDGIIDYDEKGSGRNLIFIAHNLRLPAVNVDNSERLRIRFLLAAVPLQCMNREWNTKGYHFNSWTLFNSAVTASVEMARASLESSDPFVSGMVWGKGKWPSIQFAQHWHICTQIYGSEFPNSFDVMVSPYGLAFQYADLQYNRGTYIVARTGSGSADAISRYHKDVEHGASLLPFTLYVPPTYGKARDKNILNVEETDDPGLIFTVSFNDGREVWQELSLLSIP
ncbi:MAG TPA: DUF362 domain-containing protein [Dehalococcoidia bacterium]|nr:DUF362 domain-containing protein [Dehalococcoidia bacterium]